jgi:hypothetical protein
MLLIKRRIVTAVALTVSLVAMATGQQTPVPAPSQPTAARPVAPAQATTIAPRASAVPTPARSAIAAAVAPVLPVVQSTTSAVAAPSPAPAQSTSPAAVTLTAPPSAIQPALAPTAVAPVRPGVQSTTTVASPRPARVQSTSPASVTLTAPPSAIQPALAPTAVAPVRPGVQSTTTVASPRPARVQSTSPASVSLAVPSQPAPLLSTTPAAPAEFWQQSPQRPSTQPTAAQTAPARTGSDYVEEKGFKGKVFEIKHRDPDTLSNVLKPLGSGFKGATISTNNQFKTVTVRDFPENIATIEEAIKRLDTPETPSPDIEFTVHIMIASNSDISAGELSPELTPVVRQLQSTLRYKNYVLMTSAIHRGKEGSNPASNSGIAESKLLGVTTPQGNPIFYNYSLSRIVLDALTTSPRVQVGAFQFGMRAPLVMGNDGKIQYENIGFNTPVAVREGEKVVVGTTSMGDKGLVVVLSAKVLK